MTAANAADYLHETCRVPAEVPIAVRELTGGVSNVVLRVDVAGRPPLVLKQCRARLRVPMEWYSRLDRIWTERATLDVLAGLLPDGNVPRVLFADLDNYLFAMTCAPDDAVTWKQRLMASAAGSAAIARQVGQTLRTIHRDAAGHPALRDRLADTSLFEELRIDPYYRTVARVDSDLAPALDQLIASMARPDA